MGLSGAEDDALNQQCVDYLTNFHGDVAKHFSLNSDAICVIQAAFEKGFYQHISTSLSMLYFVEELYNYRRCGCNNGNRLLYSTSESRW